ncbi:MAG: porin family protein [Bacteroidota bacterium]
MMKRVLYIVLFTLLIIEAKAAKMDSLTNNSKLFVTVGINQNTLLNNSLFTQPIVGMEAGANVLTHWQKGWHTEIGLQYIRKGSAREVVYTNSVNDKVGSYTENIYLHYIQLPIVIKKYIPVHKNVNMALGIGVYNALLFSAWVNPQHSYLNHEQAKNYNTYDFGLTGSFGVVYKNEIGIQIRYEQGLLNVSKNNGGINNTFALSLFFNLNKLKNL